MLFSSYQTPIADNKVLTDVIGRLVTVFSGIIAMLLYDILDASAFASVT